MTVHPRIKLGSGWELFRKIIVISLLFGGGGVCFLVFFYYHEFCSLFIDLLHQKNSKSLILEVVKVQISQFSPSDPLELIPLLSLKFFR